MFRSALNIADARSPSPLPIVLVLSSTFYATVSALLEHSLIAASVERKLGPWSWGCTSAQNFQLPHTSLSCCYTGCTIAACPARFSAHSACQAHPTLSGHGGQQSRWASRLCSYEGEKQLLQALILYEHEGVTEIFAPAKLGKNRKYTRKREVQRNTRRETAGEQGEHPMIWRWLVRQNKSHGIKTVTWLLDLE